MPPPSIVIARRVLMQIFRDRRTFGMMIAVPFIITLIFGSAVSGEIKNAPITVVNDDLGINLEPIGLVMFSTSIITTLESDIRLEVTQNIDWNDAKQRVDVSEIRAAIYFPDNFSSVLNSTLSSESTSIIIYVDSTEAQTRAAIMAALFDAFQTFEGTEKLKTVEELANDGQELSGFDLAIPSVIAYILNFMVILITTLTLTRETTYRTRTRLFTTPIRPADVALGYTIALCILSVIMAIVVLLVGTLVFGATVQGNWLLLLFAIIIYSLSFVFLGVFLSTQARNELQAVQMAPLITLPSLAISGFLIPIESLPDVIQPLAYIIPLTYGIRIMKGIMLKDYGFSDLFVEFTAIGIFCIVCLVLALAAIKEEQ